MRILLHRPDGKSEAWIKDFAQYLPEAEIEIWHAGEKNRPCDYAVVWAPTPRLLDQLAHVKAIFLMGAGVDALVVDTAHGHSKGVIERVRWVKQNYPNIDVIGGNIATGAAALALAEAGADGVKVGTVSKKGRARACATSGSNHALRAGRNKATSEPKRGPNRSAIACAPTSQHPMWGDITMTPRPCDKAASKCSAPSH